VHAVAHVFNALCYKAVGLGFCFKCCHWNFPLTQYFRPHCGPGVNYRNTGGAWSWRPYHPRVSIVFKFGSLNFLEPWEHVQACTGNALPLHFLDVTPCGLAEIRRLLTGCYCLYPQTILKRRCCSANTRSVMSPKIATSHCVWFYSIPCKLKYVFVTITVNFGSYTFKTLSLSTHKLLVPHLQQADQKAMSTFISPRHFLIFSAKYLG